MDEAIRPRPEKLRIRPQRMPGGKLAWACEGRGLSGWGYSPAWALRSWRMRKAGAIPRDHYGARTYDLAMHRFDQMRKVLQPDEVAA